MQDKEQYERSLEIDWAYSKISQEEMEKRKKILNNKLRGPESSSKTIGLISLLKNCYDRMKGPQGYPH
jgi:hypothetical protein